MDQATSQRSVEHRHISLTYSGDNVTFSKMLAPEAYLLVYYFYLYPNYNTPKKFGHFFVNVIIQDQNQV